MMDDAQHADRIDRALRWRLVLGRHAEAPLPLDGPGQTEDQGLAEGGDEAGALEQTLDYIYEREHASRAHRAAGGEGDGLTVPAWLSGVRVLFPREAVEIIERDALHRYGMTELVTDPDVLARAVPSRALVRAILQFKHRMSGPVLDVAREVVRAVVDDLVKKIERQTHRALHGPARPDDRPPPRTWRNVHWHGTIRDNLRHWDTDRDRLVLQRVRFHHRSRARARWRVILAVDQSGSMLDSLIHASIMAAVFSSLPAIDVRLLLWDHRLVDMSHAVTDPLEVLMGVQLGGGTDLAPALRWCADQVTEPDRTLVVVISDWYIWTKKVAALGIARELHEAGVRCIGLCALDADARPAYDERFARALADAGWFVAALTPKQLADHVGGLLR